MHVALVNSNFIKPPIAPIGLDYVAEALNASGHQVEICDPLGADDCNVAIIQFFRQREFDLVGVTLRNTDDCVFTSRQSFLETFCAMVKNIRQYTEGLIILGGVGFSVMPEEVLNLCGADAGIWGEGEFSLVDLANRLEEKKPWLDLPNLIWRTHDRWHRNPSLTRPLRDLPPMSRSWIDNRRYFNEGGQAGFETKRGCPKHCIYCADPIAKGNEIKTRPPQAVGDELERLLEQGIDHLHTCDSEFNLPYEHALEVCQEIIRRHLGEKLRWYAYCAPVPFSPELARTMRRAGCVGINFGVDSGDGEILRRLGRDFSPDDIAQTVRWCKESGIAVMLDLLLGSPGESKGSLVRTLELMKHMEPERVGVAVGVRVYPGTELAHQVKSDGRQEGLVGGRNGSEPLFFLEPRIAPFVFDLLDERIGADRHFFFFDPSRPEQNYNYNANQRLSEAIGKGYRGAYWDILRRYE
ncbi:MAG: B12-binding domain-containing radical SAM protein [Thermodesulfobacteriota bacterium]|nr:B12-binding domain-containing radical SAM protein [Thermodesulfobacteriota bacterium]